MPRNRLAQSWMAERRRRAKAKRKPASARVQLVLGGGLLASLLGLTIFLGGFADTAMARARGVAHGALADAGFTLEHVEVRGARRAKAEEVAAALLVEPGELIFNFDPAAARERVAEIEWVEDAAVLRLLPNRVIVVVDERRPLARWGRPDGVVVLDSAGGVIDGADPAAYDGLPLVEGEEAPAVAQDLVVALERHPALMRRARAFVRVGDRRWDMTTQEGVLVRLPEGAPESALDRLAALQARENLLDLPLALVDLRGGGLVLRPLAIGADGAAGFERGA